MEFILRGILIVLFLVWVAGAFYLHSIVKADEAEIARIQQMRKQQEERSRRVASFDQRRIEEKLNRSTTNAVDSLRKKENNL